MAKQITAAKSVSAPKVGRGRGVVALLGEPCQPRQPQLRLPLRPQVKGGPAMRRTFDELAEAFDDAPQFLPPRSRP